MTLKFDPESPFPLLPTESHTYVEAQAHSKKVDAWLGLETEKIESQLVLHGSASQNSSSRKESDPQVLWVGLPVQTLLTPYTEIRSILHQLGPRPGQTVVDLGAGYGRMGFVICRHYPGVKFVGYEFVGERVREGRRCLELSNCSMAQMEEADLGAPSFTPVPADFYFIYDFGARWAIEKSLQDLRHVAKDRAVVVVGRGRSSRDAIERGHPWLSQVIPPRHFAHYSIYRSAGTD